MKALRDPPPPPPDYTPKRTTLGALMRKSYDSVHYDQLVTLILPRHVFLWNETEKKGYAIYQRAWVVKGHERLVAAVYQAKDVDENPTTCLLKAPGPFASDHFESTDGFVLATEDLTPPKDSLQYRAAMCIARHWGTDDPAHEGKTRMYNEAERERIWERTLLIKKWREMAEEKKK